MRKLLTKTIIVAAALALMLLLGLAYANGGWDMPAPTATPGHTAAPTQTQQTPSSTPTPTFEPLGEYVRNENLSYAPAVHEAAASSTQTSARPGLSKYSFSLNMTEVFETGKVYGSMLLSYVSTSVEPLHGLKLNLYANAEAVDSLKLSSVVLSGSPAYYELSSDGSLLTVPLNRPLVWGERAELMLEFTIDMPHANKRFSYNDTAALLGNALPIMAVYENGGWHESKYFSHGDPFYSDVADYSVSITVLNEHQVLHAGRQHGVSSYNISNSTKTLFATGKSLRDFTIAVYESGELATARSLSGTPIYCIAPTYDQAHYAAMLAAESINLFEAKLGAYPHESLSIAACNFDGGMEYSSFIMVGGSAFKQGVDLGELIIAHEVAHQWFYSAVGSDQIESPWLDESLAEFLGMYYFEQKYGKPAADELWLERYEQYRTLTRTLPLDSPAYAFEPLEYYLVVYGHGALVFREFELTFGADMLFDVLRRYYEENKFNIGTSEHLLSAFGKSFGADLTEWLQRRIAVSWHY